MWDSAIRSRDRSTLIVARRQFDSRNKSAKANYALETYGHLFWNNPNIMWKDIRIVSEILNATEDTFLTDALDTLCAYFEVFNTPSASRLAHSSVCHRENVWWEGICRRLSPKKQLVQTF